MEQTIENQRTKLSLCRVAEIAKAKGNTTQQIADGADVRYNTALSYMRDTAGQVRLEVLDKIAYVLDVEPGNLIVRVPIETGESLPLAE